MKKSSLVPDDVDRFEEAASYRPNSESPLQPPYDPSFEQRPPRRSQEKPRRKPPANSREMREFRLHIESHDPFRVKVMRRHIAWMKRKARRWGYDIEEMDLWTL